MIAHTASNIAFAPIILAYIILASIIGHERQLPLGPRGQTL